MTLGIVIGIIAGNFGYQYFGGQDWATAVDRTWFQLVTIGAVLFVQYIEAKQ